MIGEGNPAANVGAVGASVAGGNPVDAVSQANPEDGA